MVEAMLRLLLVADPDMTLERVAEVWKGYDEEKQKAIRARADVRAMIAKIQLERAEAKATDTAPLEL